MYRWNSAITAAFWEPVGHLEVALRNTLDDRLAARHRRLGRQGSWLDDPARELTDRARMDVGGARDRVRQKGKCASDGQTISELSFGFWRFLITKKMTMLWPDLATGFPHAPDRRRETVEAPLSRLHVFRNRLAHHQRVWSHAPAERYEDLLILAGYIDPALPGWIEATSRVRGTLATKPRAQPLGHLVTSEAKQGLMPWIELQMPGQSLLSCVTTCSTPNPVAAVAGAAHQERVGMRESRLEP